MGKLNGQREVLWGLIGGISEHYSLIASSELLQSFLVVQTLSNIRALLLNSDQDIASLVVKSLLRVVVSNILDRIADDLLVVELRLSRDFTEDHDHTSLGGRLAGHLRERIILEAGIENGVGDLISDLVWMALTD